MFKYLCVSVLSLFLSASVMAGVVMDSGSFSVSYKEPVTNADGTPLNDLGYTTIYYSLNGAARVKVMDIPASSVNGGGEVHESFTISITGDQVDVFMIYTATDKSGNESLEYVEDAVRIDQTPPASPEGL